MLQKHFKLEQVLKYRTEIERVRIQDFFSAKSSLEHAADRLKAEESALKELVAEFRDRQQELETIDDLQLYAHFFSRKRNDVKRGKQEVADLTVVVDDSRQKLLDATKDKKALESLKEKKAQEFRTAMGQKEQLFMDEISVQKKRPVE